MKKLIRRVYMWSALCLVLCGAFSHAAAEGSDYEALFRKASSFYEQGDYARAIELYSEVLAEGYESGNLYYNLGNCYFKAGSLGKAIAQYTRARRLIPRDADCAANYAYARSLVKEPELKNKKTFFWRLIDYVLSSFTIDELTVLAMLLGCGALFISGLFIAKRLSARTYLYALVPILFLFSLVVLSVVARVQSFGKEAVVITEEAEARFGPFEEATVHFSVYEGMPLSVVEKKGAWYKIERADGTAGWVVKDALEII
jgi:tetratricopeptide (TPR) repeat protein